MASEELSGRAKAVISSLTVVFIVAAGLALYWSGIDIEKAEALFYGPLTICLAVWLCHMVFFGSKVPVLRAERPLFYWLTTALVILVAAAFAYFGVEQIRWAWD